MSIPPLVCSTPPPPDQCEDDKDGEDFDLSYSLSQEDDDDENNGYNYGNLSYNNFQPAPDNKSLEIKETEITINIESEVQKETFLKYGEHKDSDQDNGSHNVFGTNDINENKLKCDEDTNIEDLNLKVDEEIESIVESNVEHIETSEPSVGNIKDFDIPSNNDSPSCDNTNLSSFEDNAIDSGDSLKVFDSELVDEPLGTQPIEVITKVELDTGDPETSFQVTSLQDNKEEEDKELSEPLQFEETSVKSDCSTHIFEQLPGLNDVKSDDNVIDDDFGDFDDFQSVNTKSHVTHFVDDNPWQNTDSNESDFGNFTANFEEIKYSMEDVPPAENISESDTLDKLNCDAKAIDNSTEDDDFGDFNDFKSSAVKTIPNDLAVEDSSQCQDMPVLNFQSIENEHQNLECINKVLSSVFLEEIAEPESEFEGKLESLLSETWGHLMETDERQPYIVNWNNSLGQKTLLRALCIDSRNILFGPKWSSNMPKYAANLSIAPLQPQKQATVPTSVVTPNEPLTEKISSKPTTWNDPFTSDGQESCNTESAPITSGPTDLDVFEAAAASTKPDKIYSNTIGVQPLRQINLPDTHIFTPTDSEIPRSKTIHYDHGPTVLLPQPALADNKNQTDTVNTPTANSVVQNNIDDNEYWEFQNFKSTTERKASLPGISINSQQETSQEKHFETATIVNALPKSNIAYQTELLQPIRVEPAMPTLNWPDPGEVKVFDDFSDFVSTSQFSERQDSRSQFATGENNLEKAKINKCDSFSAVDEKIETDVRITNIGNNLDDDFDTFQSAQPSSSASGNFLGNPTNQMSPSHITEFDNGSPKFDRIKSDTISFGSIPRPKEALTQNIGNTSNTELTNKTSSSTQLTPNLLQPTPATFSAVNLQSQQKSAQILQPLSLESYSQINWPSPGIDLQDLSRFNPVETLHSLKSDLSVSGVNKVASPVHAAKTSAVNQAQDDDGWGEFVSSKPKQQQQQPQPKKPSVFVDDDEWTDFISSPSVKPQNGLNTISLNVHTNSNIQKSAHNKFNKKSTQPPLDIPTLNYITPKSNPHKSYNDKHFQNL